MTPIPFDLPISPSEAGALAGLIFEHAEGKTLNEDIRGRIAGRAAKIAFENLTPYIGSLEKDPVHPSSYYLAVDATTPLVLHMALAAAPTGSIYPKSLLIGRMRTTRGKEIVINAVPFASVDHDNIRKYAEQVNRAFLPRPQGPQPAIAVGSLPAAFEAFRAILKNRGRNLASITLSSDSYHAGLWAAIRAGWREGYTIEADPFIITGGTPAEIRASVNAAKEAIRRMAGCTKFTTDTSRLVDKFEHMVSAEEREWILGEFGRPYRAGDSVYIFAPDEVERLAVRFGQSLKINEELCDAIRTAKAGQPARAFDFEVSLAGAGTPTAPKELIFYLHWLKARGRMAQLVAPDLGSNTDLKEVAAVARHFHATLSIHSTKGTDASELDLIGKATGGRVNYKISEECDAAHIIWVAENLLG